MKKILVVIITAFLLFCFSGSEAAELRIRLGQGGLHEPRAEDGQLGGGQLALDLFLPRLPLFISLSSEYYKKSAEATYQYEIEGLFALYLSYRKKLPFKRKSEIYIGGGVGYLHVPVPDSDQRERGFVFDGACGANIKIYKRLGGYIEGKYIYSKKTKSGERVIDFSDVGLLLGISFDFCL